MLRRSEMESAAETIRQLLAAVGDGELSAPPGLVARLEGAALALEALAGTLDPSQ